MLKAHLMDMKCIRFDSLKAKIHVPTNECIDVQGTTFIRINPRNATMIAALTEGNAMAPALNKKSKSFSLSSSDGLREMIKLRNHAQARSLAPVEPTMFANPEDTMDAPAKSKQSRSKQPRKHITHKLKAERRKALTVIDISITVRGEQHVIKVLRPMHGRDALWVEYCDTSIATVIEYLRDNGFSEQQRNYRTLHSDLPATPGIHYRNGHFLVPKGSKRVRANDIDEVNRILNESDGEHDAAGEEHGEDSAGEASAGDDDAEASAGGGASADADGDDKDEEVDHEFLNRSLQQRRAERLAGLAASGRALLQKSFANAASSSNEICIDEEGYENL
jgi:hypothetical protein